MDIYTWIEKLKQAFYWKTEDRFDLFHQTFYIYSNLNIDPRDLAIMIGLPIAHDVSIVK